MHILHLITRLDLGGSATNTILTSIGQKRAGHDVTIVSGLSEYPPSEHEKQAIALGVKIKRIRWLVRSISLLNDFLSIFYLFFLIKQGKFSIVHTHTSKAGISGRIAAWLAGVKCIVHTSHGHIFWGYASPFVTNIFISIEKIVSKITDAHIFLTEQEKNDYRDQGIGKGMRLYTIASGIDLELFKNKSDNRSDIRKKLNLEESHIVAATVARFSHIKNHDLIISAVNLLGNQYPDLRFAFFGDGELKEHIVERIEELGLQERFRFAGWTSNIPEALIACDFFVLCSHNEGMGRAFVEAQAAGLPVIGSRMGGIPEVVKEGVTGFLVSPDNPTELVDALSQMYSLRDSFKDLSSICKEWAFSNFGAETMVQKINTVYSEVLLQVRQEFGSQSSEQSINKVYQNTKSRISLPDRKTQPIKKKILS